MNNFHFPLHEVMPFCVYNVFSLLMVKSDKASIDYDDEDNKNVNLAFLVSVVINVSILCHKSTPCVDTVHSLPRRMTIVTITMSLQTP